MGWRLIDTDVADPYYVTAADDALAQTRKEHKSPNTLHFYRRHPPAVSVGRSRKIHEDINVEACRKNKVHIVRRTTGGGTIYTDKGCLIYSVVFDKNDIGLRSSQEIFENICQSIVHTLEKFDIHTIYKPPNDILLHGKKISGSAQIAKDNVVLIHGTILLHTNLEVLNTVLKVPSNNKVTTIQSECSDVPSINELKETLKNEFEKEFGDTLEKKPFTRYETQVIEKLLTEKYRNDTWNFMR